MGDLALEVRGQVDDCDGGEWALLGADTTTNAEGFGNEGDSRLGGHFDTELAAADDGARFLAFLSTFLGLALVTVDNGNTGGETISLCRRQRI